MYHLVLGPFALDLIVILIPLARLNVVLACYRDSCTFSLLVETAKCTNSAKEGLCLMRYIVLDELAYRWKWGYVSDSADEEVVFLADAEFDGLVSWHYHR